MTSLLKRLSRSIITISSLFIIISCNTKKSDIETLSVTIEPQRYFLEQIVKDKYKIVSLVPAGSNPENFDPAPSQMITLNNSKAYFKVGFLGIENALIDKIKDQTELNIIDCSVGIDIIQEDHHHDNGDEHVHQHGHDGGDPHYWNSIYSAKIILKNMLEGMIKIDEKNKEVYTKNYNEEIARINDTDSIISDFIGKSNSKTFIIYHPALSYFAEEYDLEQLSIEHEGKSPSPSQLKKLIDEANEKNVKVVFIQQEFDTKNAETIAKQIDAKIYTINLLSYNWHDEMIEIATVIAEGDE